MNCFYFQYLAKTTQSALRMPSAFHQMGTINIAYVPKAMKATPSNVSSVVDQIVHAVVEPIASTPARTNTSVNVIQATTATVMIVDQTQAAVTTPIASSTPNVDQIRRPMSIFVNALKDILRTRTTHVFLMFNFAMEPGAQNTRLAYTMKSWIYTTVTVTRVTLETQFHNVYSLTTRAILPMTVALMPSAHLSIVLTNAFVKMDTMEMVINAHQKRLVVLIRTCAIYMPLALKKMTPMFANAIAGT